MHPFAKHLETNLQNHDSGLGDRSLYFGASEILSCEEALFLSKIKKEKRSFPLQQIIVMQKGNIAEELVKIGFGDKLDFEEQVEVKGIGEYDFFQAHIDFVVNFPGESIVVEVKTTNDIPDTPRESWWHQIQVQMGLSGLKRGIIFAMNLNTGQYEIFDVEFNRFIFNNTMRRVKDVWERIHSLPHNQFKGTKSALCSYCPFRMDCNTLKANDVLPEDIETMASKAKRLKKEAKVLEENVKAFMQVAGFKRARGKDVVIECSTRNTGERIDFAKFKTHYPDVYKAVLKENNKVEVMTIY